MSDNKLAANKLRVSICGAGIGGLTCAIALSKYPDIHVELFEAASQISEVGAGFGVWPRPWKVLESLGLANDLLKLTNIKPTTALAPAIHWRKSDQVKGFPFYTLQSDGVLLPFSRADFQTALLRHVVCPKHLSKRLVSYSHNASGLVEVHFEDGTTTTCDVLIGADGVKSAVRRSMLSQLAKDAESKGEVDEAAELTSAIEPSWCGTVVYRTTFPADRLKEVAAGHPVLKSFTQFLGRDAHVIAYPISQGKTINMAAFFCRHDLEGSTYNGPWVTHVGQDELLGCFTDWEPDLQILIGCVDRAMKWAVHTVKPLKSFISEQVALIGDAAHAEQPTQGAGAGQAIEDAYFLATILGHPSTTIHTIPQALAIYDSFRRPFSVDVAERSRRNNLCFSLQHPVVADLQRCGDQEMRRRLVQMAEIVHNNWQWVWSTTLDGSIKEALRMLESRTH